MTPARVRELGGDVAKMLFYMRSDQREADRRSSSTRSPSSWRRAGRGRAAHRRDPRLPARGESDEAYGEIFPELVADAARIAVAAGSKVLKLQYPGSAEAGAAVTEAAAGVPWAVLSAGVDHETFVGQVRTAVENGAGGAMAGRSLWKDSLSIASAKREELLTNRALPRLRELADVVDGAAAIR